MGQGVILSSCTSFCFLDNGLSPLPNFSLDIHLTSLQWNPAIPDILAVSLSNTLQLLIVKDDVVIAATKVLSANASELGEHFRIN